MILVIKLCAKSVKKNYTGSENDMKLKHKDGWEIDPKKLKICETGCEIRCINIEVMWSEYTCWIHMTLAVKFDVKQVETWFWHWN